MFRQCVARPGIPDALAQQGGERDTPVGRGGVVILGARRRRLTRRWLWRSSAAAALLLAALAASALAWRQFVAMPAEPSPAPVSAAPAALGATAPGDDEEAG